MDSVRMSDLSAKEFADVGDPGRFMATSTTDPTAPSTNEPQREEIKGGATTTHCAKVMAKDIQEVLEKQLAYLTGGMDGPQPILVIPKVGLKTLNPDHPAVEEVRHTLRYFRSLLSDDLVSNGLTVLVEATSSSTGTAVKAVLEMLASADSPLTSHVMYVLIKPPRFGKSKPLVSTELATKLKLSYFNNLNKDLPLLDPTQIPKEMGGLMVYSHQGWIRNRLDYEHICRLCGAMREEIPKIKASLDSLDMPEDVKAAERTMQESLMRRERIFTLLTEAEMPIHTFLKHLNHPGEEEVGTAMTKAYNSMIASLGEMLEELKEEEKGSNAFWTVHKARLDHFLRICHFKKSAEKVKHLMEEHQKDVTGEVVIGDTLEAALELGEKHESFVNKCRETMDGHMTRMKEEGQELCTPHLPSQDGAVSALHACTMKAISLVQSSLQDLTQTYDNLFTICNQKRDLFIITVKFHLTTRQIEQWSQQTLEFLASQPLENITFYAANTLAAKVDDFLTKLNPTQVQFLREMAKVLPDKQFKKSAEKTAQKLEHARELLENRKTGLLKIIAVSLQPPPKPQNGPSPRTQKKDISVVQSIQFSSRPTSNQPDTTDSVQEADQEYTDTEADPKELKTRQNIYEELVTTERDYVTDMQHVISSYYDEMSPEIVALPARLRGKRYDVFCNITDIHAFHSSTFLGALQSWETNPIRVGESFLKHAAAFQDLYSAYCKNKAHSETVMSESAECEAFFREIQVRLNDKLPLSSYLIKPVQRITKYQLLLKDLIKHTAKATKAQADLRMALDKMLKVLQTLNDSLKAVGLKGYPGTLAEQGKLLLQDRFRVFESTDTKFSRGRDRHVFLFEKVLICSKKMEVEESQKKGKKSEAYVYKDHIQMAEIAIREQMGDHSLNFELMVHGQQRLIKFQAFSKDIKELWVSEMRRLLQLQFTLIKDMVVKSGTLDRMVYKGQAKEAINTKLAVADSCVKAPKSKSIKDFLKPGIKKSSEATPTVKASKLDITSSLVLTRNKAVACPEASLQISRNKSPDATDSFSSDEECSVGDNDEDDTLATEDQYESLAPGVPRIYKAICDYSPSSAENGIIMQIGQTVEVIGINQYGWWWVRLLSQEMESTREGWVPASYLQVSKETAIKKP